MKTIQIFNDFTCWLVWNERMLAHWGQVSDRWLCWGLTSQSTIFQSCRDGAIASWVINQYFRGVKCLAQGHNTAAVGLEPRTSRSGVRHSTTEPPRSPPFGLLVWNFYCKSLPLFRWKILGQWAENWVGLETLNLKYCNDPKFSDRQVYANSVDPDQTASRGAVWSGSTLLAILSASFTYYFMVKQPCSDFSLITANCAGDWIFYRRQIMLGLTCPLGILILFLFKDSAFKYTPSYDATWDAVQCMDYWVNRAYQRQFASILYVKYADVILMMGINCLTVKF